MADDEKLYNIEPGNLVAFRQPAANWGWTPDGNIATIPEKPTPIAIFINNSKHPLFDSNEPYSLILHNNKLLYLEKHLIRMYRFYPDDPIKTFLSQHISYRRYKDHYIAVRDNKTMCFIGLTKRAVEYQLSKASFENISTDDFVIGKIDA